MASLAELAEMRPLVPRRFRWEDVGFELDNIEKGMDDEWS
jgi:hypothetical protein